MSFQDEEQKSGNSEGKGFDEIMAEFEDKKN